MLLCLFLLQTKIDDFKKKKKKRAIFRQRFFFFLPTSALSGKEWESIRVDVKAFREARHFGIKCIWYFIIVSFFSSPHCNHAIDSSQICNCVLMIISHLILAVVTKLYCNFFASDVATCLLKGKKTKEKKIVDFTEWSSLFLLLLLIKECVDEIWSVFFFFFFDDIFFTSFWFCLNTFFTVHLISMCFVYIYIIMKGWCCYIIRNTTVVVNVFLSVNRRCC